MNLYWRRLWRMDLRDSDQRRKKRFQKVSRGVSEDHDYISWNDFILDMNRKYGTSPGEEDREG